MRPVRRDKDVRPFKYKNPTIAADPRVVTKLLYRFHKYVPMSERALSTFRLTWAEIAFFRSIAKESPLLNVSGRRIKRLRIQMEPGGHNQGLPGLSNWKA